jgi:signal transduction histidine kinase
MAMSALSGALAHDLSQPIGSICFNAEAARRMLATNRASPVDLMAIIQDIVDGGERASAIVGRHRQMLQQRGLEKRPLDLCAVARDSIAIVAHAAETRGVLLDNKLSRERRPVLGDSVMLQQVIVNLLMNAMEAMGDTPTTARRVAIRDELDANGVVISVRDSGTGLSPGIRDRLFEPFVTSKADGVGIGLTIVNAIVQAHGGTVVGVDNPQGGATFSFRLPLTPS